MVFALVLGTVVVAALVGAVLLVAGLRGRRIDDHPICRGCRFDLVGLYPAAAKCPECGSTLTGSKKTVRIGARRRRKGLLIVAVPLLLIGLGGGGALGWAGATSYNWYPVAPEWVLEAVAGFNDPVKQRNAVGELTTRLVAGTLDSERADRLIERGLEIQGDRSLAWVPEWGDLIEAGLNADRLSRAQYEAYATQGTRCTLSVRRRVRAEENAMIGISTIADRFGSGTTARVNVSWPSIVADGTEISPAEVNSGGSYTFRGSGVGSGSRPVMISLKPGRYTLASKPVLEFTLTGRGSQVAAEPVVRTVEVSREIEVVPVGAALVELIDDPSLGPAMAAGISVPQLLVFSEGEGFVSMSAQVRGTGLPVGFAFDVLIRDIDGELHHWARMALAAGAGRYSMGTMGTIEARVGEVADVVLRASEEALLLRSDLESAWDGEIVIEDVPVVRPKSEDE